MIPPCLTLNIIRHVSRVKGSNPGKGVAPSSTPRCCIYWKWSLRVAFDYDYQLTYLDLHTISSVSTNNYFLDAHSVPQCFFLGWVKHWIQPWCSLSAYLVSFWFHCFLLLILFLFCFTKQLFWVIKCQSYPFRITVKLLFHPYLMRDNRLFLWQLVRKWI